MRSGRLRLALVAGAFAGLIVVAGCSPAPAAVDAAPTGSPTGSESPTPTASPAPTAPPVDPAVTYEVCTQASNATAATTALFNEQIAALEQAAARNDQAGMVTAAEAINKQFQALSAALATMAQRQIGDELKKILTDISEALAEMASLSYTGTTVDIRKKLLDFAAAFTTACVPPGSPTPTPNA
jgi:flagellin-specific chaperone FliS